MRKISKYLNNKRIIKWINKLKILGIPKTLISSLKMRLNLVRNKNKKFSTKD
jgi:hypothetical protein